jgi:hypothetical protein
MRTNSIANERYSPLYFLAALGLGGLSVTFFMYLMFWVPHKGQPVPVFEDIAAAFSTGGPATQAMIAVAMAGIAIFTLLHLRAMAWNLSRFSAFRRTKAYEALRSGNAETQLMAVPLALAMTINTMFIAGLVFVPQLWSVVEYLFPFAIAAFLALGVYAFSIMGDFFGRVMTRGGFDCAKNNSFAQLMPALALGMIGVGLAAPAAMSNAPATVAIAYVASSLFIVAAVMLAAAKAVLGLRAMLENGASDEGAPTLWVLIPIVTVIGIAMMRQSHGMHVAFGVHTQPADNFMLLTTLMSIQALFGMLGYKVLAGKNYFGRYIFGEERSAGSYALVCPFVALNVLGHFFVNKGLVAAGIIAKFGVAYWSMSAILIVLQLLAIGLVFKLNAGHFGLRQPPAAIPAE